jgi:serine phosphatase RsbU (regulator of sigma subunit)
VLEPAREVGGDFDDFFLLDDRHLYFMIGDVSGKGLPASLIMAAGRSLCKSTALRRGPDAAGIACEVDVEISRDNPESFFIAAVIGVLDARTGRLEWCSAGHEPPYLFPHAGALPTPLEGSVGPPLCTIEGFRYEAAARQ